MRAAGAFILSVSAVFGFACTGEDPPSDGQGGTETGGGGASGTAGLAGGAGGTAGSAGMSSGGGGTAAGGATSGGTGGVATGGSGAATTGGSAGEDGGSAGASGGGAGANGGSSGANGGSSGASGSSAGANGGAAGANGGMAGAGGGAPVVPSLLVFSRTTGYRHESIPDGIAALRNIAMSRGWDIVASEDPSIFSDSGLAPFNVLVFLSPSDEFLDTAQQGAFERYIRAGRGYAGIHAASAGEYDWPFYGEVVGAFFREHPAIQQAVVRVETDQHPSTATLPAMWSRTDEWYSFRANPRPNVTVLLTLDESSYAPGTSTMGADHPIAWYHVYEGARCFYTALGHTRESYTEAAFLAHITGGIEWAAGR